jgi:hypothetical protein
MSQYFEQDGLLAKPARREPKKEFFVEDTCKVVLVCSSLVVISLFSHVEQMVGK